MALSKIQAESMNLADTFAFTGTVSGTNGMTLLQTVNDTSDVDYGSDVTIFNFFLLGWLSSGTSYVLNMIFGDNGVKHEHTNMDKQVDASTS